MKTNIIKVSTILVFALALLPACTKNFEAINTNPNSPTPEQVDPRFVLTTAFNRTILTSTNFQNSQLLLSDIYAQFYANDLGATYNSYNQVDQSIVGLWTSITYTYLNALNTVIRQFSDKPEYANMVQMARIWKSWLMLRATNYWGDIPYFKACDGSGEAAPYDKQQDILYDILTVLADAASKFDNTKLNPGSQDIVFAGNNASWIRFAQSLRLRIAMQISNVDPVRAKTEAEAAIAAGVISSAAQTASVLCDVSGQFAEHPIANIFAQGGFGMSLTMENVLSGLGGQAWPADVPATEKPATVDPRGPIMFNPSSTASSASAGYIGRWTGTYPGLASTTAPELTTFNNARIGGLVYTNPSRRFNILKYSEVCFLIAEAKVRFPAWNTGAGTAQSWYEAGIRANMNEWNIPVTMVDAYLTSESANKNGTTALYTHTAGDHNTTLDKVITQKWIAMFPENGLEAWTDHRRLQIPRFIPFQNVNTQWFPGEYDMTDKPQNYGRRIGYPVSEQTLNKANFDVVLQTLGGQPIGYIRKPMWWDPYKEDGSLK